MPGQLSTPNGGRTGGASRSGLVFVARESEPSVPAREATWRSLNAWREITGSDPVRFVAKEKSQNRFPDCGIGALPPFANRYGVEVYAAESLAGNEERAFTAGLHEEIIKQSFREFARLAEPRVTAFTT